MEAQTNLETYLEQGKQALAQGQGREAAVAYAHAAQMEPTNPLVHLGLAEANLALGAYGVVHMACRKTQEIALSGPLYDLAQALLDLLDRRYDRALHAADAAIQTDPGNAYAHALRAYLLRVTNQNYDAGLARSRASRLSFGGKFENCFPTVESTDTNGYSGSPTSNAAPSTPIAAVEGQPQVASQSQQQQQREQIPAWSRPNNIQRRMVRTRFWLSQNSRLATNIIIGLNVLVYLVLALLSQNFLSISQNVLVNMGAQVGFLVATGDYWRIFTAMFIHFDITHIALNMLSLYFIGSFVEALYGKWRYLVIYLVTGIVGGIVTYFLIPQNFISAGASGAIAGVFGALGIFFFVNRRALGPAANAMLSQWGFWLLINVAFDFSVPDIGWQDHLGGLIAGLILGLILLPPLRRRTRRV
ncbi:MAG: rhomboid family intramembrane serine protease [Ktedonobacteraceae bacterium]